MLMRVWRKGNPCTLLMRMCIGAAIWKTVWRLLKKLKSKLPYDPAIPLLGIYLEKNKNTNSERYLHPDIHSSNIYNCQDR